MKTPIQHKSAGLLLLQCLVGAFAACFGLTNLTAAEVPRLAIVSEADSLSQAADMLTAELSGKPQVQLFERDQIQRVYREQALSAANRDYLKLGQVLGADGLLLMGVVAEGTNQFLGIRLVAVKPGVILGSVRTPWPVTDVPGWAHGLGNHFAPLLPKLGVLVRDAIPISVVNLRSAVKSSEAQEVERQLTLLAIERLTHERELFVLERRRMELLSGEKELKGMEELAFWNGSYLLDGILDRDGYPQDTVTLSARLVPPKGGAPVAIEISGSRTNLAEVADRLAGKVATTLKLGLRRPEWNPAEEAGQYMAEAQWAYRWRMLPESIAACEASWALGNRSKELARLRIQAYLEENLDPAAGSYDLRRKLVNFSSAPDANRFAGTLRAMSLYCQDFESLVVPDRKAGQDWHDLGIGVLESASGWLRHYYFMPEARVGMEDKVAEAQDLAKRMASLIGQHPAYTNLLAYKNLLNTKAAWGVYWVETPEAGLEIYRQILSTGLMPRIRSRFLDCDYLDQGEMSGPLGPFEAVQLVGGPIRGQMELSNPYLTGWKWEDRKRVPPVWRGFIDELCVSTNPLNGLEGHFLRAANSRSDEEYDQRFRELLTFIDAHRDAIFAARLDEGLVKDIGTLVETKWKARYQAVPFKIRGDVWKKFAQSMVDYRRDYARNSRLEKARSLLSPNTVFDRSQVSEVLFKDLHSGFEYNVADARALLPLVKDYRGHLEKAAASLQGAGAEVTTKRNELTTAIADLARLEQLLTSLLLPPLTNLPTRVAQSDPVQRPDPLGLPVPNLLKVVRFWAVPEAQSLGMADATRTVYSCCFREGRLWIEFRFQEYDDAGFYDRVIFFAVDLDTFQSEAIALDRSAFRLPRPEHFRRPDRLFEVHNGWLYVSSADRIKRYSLKNHAWEDLRVPIQGRARITVLNDRLFFSTQDSILEMTPDGQSVQVLASSRRQPATSILDAVDGYGYAPLLKGPDDSITAYVRGKFYTFARASNDCAVLPLATDLSRTACSVYDEGVILASGAGSAESRMYAMRSGSLSLDTLFAQGPQSPLPRPFAPPGAGQNTSVSRWSLPPNVNPASCPVCFDGDSLWILAGALAFQRDAAGRLALKEEYGRHAVLFGLSPNSARPLSVPVWFRLPNDLSSKEFSNTLISFGPQGVRPAVVESTAKGLIVTGKAIPGFWFIPKPDLDSQKQARGPTQNQQQSFGAASGDSFVTSDRN